jgi:hypothetical protein
MGHLFIADIPPIIIFFFKRPQNMTLHCCIDNAKVSLHCHGI